MIQPAYVEPDGRGGYAIKVTIKSGDACNTAGDRAQLSGPATGEREGAERYYGFSVLFNAPWTSPQGYGTLFWEVHDTIGNANVMLAIHNVGGVQQFQLGVTGGSSTAFRVLQDFMNANTGTWNDFIIRVKWSTSNNGLAEVYHKLGNANSYVLVASNSGPTLKIGQTHGFSNEIGAYRARIPESQSLILANYKVGTTRSVVEYR